MALLQIVASGLWLAMAATAAQMPTDRAGLRDALDSLRASSRAGNVLPAAAVAHYTDAFDEIESRLERAKTTDELVKIGDELGAVADALQVERAQYANLRAPVAPPPALTAPQKSMVAASVEQNGSIFFDGDRARLGLPVEAKPSSLTAEPRSGESAQASSRLSAATKPVPAPAAEETWSWKNIFDFDRAKRLAQRVLNEAIGFTHRCYAWVAKAMESTGFFSPSQDGARGHYRSAWPPEIGGESAYMFARVKKMPEVMKRLGIATLDPKTRPLPVGTTLVYGRGCMGFSAQHGHIEVVTKASVNRLESFYACSDGCMWHTESWLDRAVGAGCVDMFIPVTESRSR